eukprot:511088-Hanusia_phi.AAC.1
MPGTQVAAAAHSDGDSGPGSVSSDHDTGPYDPIPARSDSHRIGSDRGRVRRDRPGSEAQAARLTQSEPGFSFSRA